MAPMPLCMIGLSPETGADTTARIDVPNCLGGLLVMSMPISLLFIHLELSEQSIGFDWRLSVGFCLVNIFLLCIH